MKHLSHILAGFLALPLMAAQATDPSVLKERNETEMQRDARMEWFRDARFGMFIHWGLYAQAAGEWDGKFVPPLNGCQEWIMHKGRIPVADYATLAGQFNPVKYDAEKWVLSAKDAGMKYIVITTKHHEGFAMFKTAASPFNIVDATPYGKDVLKPLVEACRKHGMKLGFYYSQNVDWHHPGGDLRGAAWDPAQKGDPEKYARGIVEPQLREILSNYGRVDMLWFDTAGNVINKPRADRIWKLVTEMQPNIVINNRLGGGYQGDTETPERDIPAQGYPGRDWETCMTMNETWGYSKFDHDWKSTTTLIRQLVDCASKGGNFLLNVGPTGEGEIPQASLERLAEMGQWTKVNGEAVYGTSATPFPKTFKWGRATQKGDMLYLFVFDLPADRRLALPGLKNRVKGAWMLADQAKTALPVTSGEADAGVTIPEGATLDTNATVVAVRLDGKPLIDVVSEASTGKKIAVSPLPFYNAATAPGDGNFNTAWAGFRDFWKNRQKDFVASRDADRGAIVFLGDSITEIAPLKKLFPNLQTANRGISGDTTRGMLYRLRDNVLDLDPRAVVLLGGCNDIQQPGASPEGTAANVKAICLAIHDAKPDIKCFVLKIMPGAKVEKSITEKFNAAVDRALAGMNFVVRVDTYTPFLQAEGTLNAACFYDGTHPNAQGYEIYRKTLMPFLSPLSK